ncbi:hypothetical protein OG746_15815 [Streptomyces sp. NBC_01016]|uniref:hypothetical protein n=1 Tax=Streptomyces sp. NBC_01016 TaxID=2903720 RepID=UPI00225583CC|nr:hypothetical protein [Streptomyces sp. NBC_01016]MCX4830198.1 hypothetical protein [Streptomyces sp. NBC_01016]
MSANPPGAPVAPGPGPTVGPLGATRTRRARRLLTALCLAACCWSATNWSTAGPSAAEAARPHRTIADGTGAHGLALDVTVNTRPGTTALRPGIRTGGEVVASYRLTNRGGADLHDLRVHDPSMPGARLHCPGGRDLVPLLIGLRSVRCTATGPARPGRWVAQVRAAGRQPYLRATVQATARSGYAGVGAALTLRQSARPTGPDRAHVTYTVTNPGNRPLHDIRVTDPGLAPDRIDCAHGRPVVPRLAPGATAECGGDVRRAPGTYTGRGLAEGSDLIRTIGARGEEVAPPRLSARATTRLVIPGAPAPRPKEPASPKPPGGPPAEPPAAPPLRPPVPAAALLLVAPPPGIAAPDPAPRPPRLPLPPRQPRQPEPPTEPDPEARTQAKKSGQEDRLPPLLRRFVHDNGRPTGLGLMAALFLVLLPAAIAAAVLGSARRH